MNNRYLQTKGSPAKGARDSQFYYHIKDMGKNGISRKPRDDA